MHIISFRILREYAETHADCQEVLSNWYKVANKANPSFVTLGEEKTIRDSTSKRETGRRSAKIIHKVD